MHVVATNLCVWLRTVVREALRDVTDEMRGNSSGPTIDHMRLGESRGKGGRSSVTEKIRIIP